MSTKNDAEVLINGKVYKLAGNESEDYLQHIASYINNKINLFSENSSYSGLTQETKNVLLNINIADDYFKAKKRADYIENDSESRSRQLYDVKQDYVTAQLRVETLEKEVAELKESLNDKDKEIIRLQAELESTRAMIGNNSNNNSKYSGKR